MSKILTPEELLNSQIDEFNRGNISFLMTLYENMHVLHLRQDKLLRIKKVFVKYYKI